MYERKSRLSPRQQSRLLEHFVAGTTARAAAQLIGVQANTAIRFYQRLRQLIASKLPSYELSGEVEADESYFGGVRKGKRGRGAAGKVPVFGLLKRRGKVYTAIIPDVTTDTLMDITEEKVTPDSIVYTDCFFLMTRWMFQTSITSVSTTASYSRTSTITSMGLRTFGTKPSDICVALMASQNSIFSGFSKSANGDSMEATIKPF